MELQTKTEHALPFEGSTEVVGLATTGRCGKEGRGKSWHPVGGLYLYFPVKPEETLTANMGNSSAFRTIVPKILMTTQQPPRLERKEKTDAVLLTNGIYLQLGSQYVIVNWLPSSSDHQKWACFLS